MTAGVGSSRSLPRSREGTHARVRTSITHRCVPAGPYFLFQAATNSDPKADPIRGSSRASRTEVTQEGAMCQCHSGAEHVRQRPSTSWRDTLMTNDRPWADRYFELTNDLLTARMNVALAA